MGQPLCQHTIHRFSNPKTSAERLLLSPAPATLALRDRAQPPTTSRTRRPRLVAATALWARIEVLLAIRIRRRGTRVGVYLQRLGSGLDALDRASTPGPAIIRSGPAPGSSIQDGPRRWPSRAAVAMRTASLRRGSPGSSRVCRRPPDWATAPLQQPIARGRDGLRALLRTAAAARGTEAR